MAVAALSMTGTVLPADAADDEPTVDSAESTVAEDRRNEIKVQLLALNDFHGNLEAPRVFATAATPLDIARLESPEH